MVEGEGNPGWREGAGGTCGYYLVLQLRVSTGDFAAVFLSFPHTTKAWFCEGASPKFKPPPARFLEPTPFPPQVLSRGAWSGD